MKIYHYATYWHGGGIATSCGYDPGPPDHVWFEVSVAINLVNCEKCLASEVFIEDWTVFEIGYDGNHEQFFFKYWRPKYMK